LIFGRGDWGIDHKGIRGAVGLDFELCDNLMALGLTKRQAKILHWIAEGKTSKEPSFAR